MTALTSDQVIDLIKLYSDLSFSDDVHMSVLIVNCADELQALKRAGELYAHCRGIDVKRHTGDVYHMIEVAVHSGLCVTFMWAKGESRNTSYDPPETVGNVITEVLAKTAEDAS